MLCVVLFCLLNPVFRFTTIMNERFSIQNMKHHTTPPTITSGHALR